MLNLPKAKPFNLDITLERILSLLPRNENGKIKRGEQAKFARSIGYDSGDIVSMWKNGSSTSYLTKIHEISAKYNVSVKWLLGETDIKEPATLTGDGLDDLQKQAFDLIKKIPTEQLQTVIGVLKAILGES